MSETDRDPAFTISGKEVKNPDTYRWQGGRSEKGVVTGKWYYEATITDNGLCRIGFATADAFQELGGHFYRFYVPRQTETIYVYAIDHITTI